MTDQSLKMFRTVADMDDFNVDIGVSNCGVASFRNSGNDAIIAVWSATQKDFYQIGIGKYNGVANEGDTYRKGEDGVYANTNMDSTVLDEDFAKQVEKRARVVLTHLELHTGGFYSDQPIQTKSNGHHVWCLA